MLKSGLYVLCLDCKCLRSSLKFCISVKIFDCILLSRECRIKGNGLFFVSIVIVYSKLFVTGLCGVSEGIEEFSPDTVLVAAFSLFQLLELFIEGM